MVIFTIINFKLVILWIQIIHKFFYTNNIKIKKKKYKVGLTIIYFTHFH